MQKEYDSIDLFIEDLHNEISLKNMTIDVGIFNKKDFDGDFVKCIFHDGDNEPSLQIKDQFFKCYACGAKGDIISFFMRYYNMDFMEAIKKIADSLSINITNFRVAFDKKSDKLKIEWNEYLNAMEKAPMEIQELKRDFFPQEIGYDKNLNYVVLPITSKNGSILGFTKRRIDFMHERLDLFKKDENGNIKFKYPKWRHSSLKDSLISQCHNIFNYYTANIEINKTGEVVLTEGPKDVIGYQRMGKNNVICSCGTQNAANVWDLILPICDNIVLSFDGDGAGISAAIKNILYLAPIFNIQNIEVVCLPDGEDPYSVKNLEKYYNERIPAVSFMIDYASKTQIVSLHKIVPEYLKIYVFKEICTKKGFSISETESWLACYTNDEENNQEINEKNLLLAFVNGEDVDVPYMTISRARKILKMKYGINI